MHGPGRPAKRPLTAGAAAPPKQPGRQRAWPRGPAQATADAHTVQLLLKKSVDKKSDSRGPESLKGLLVGTPISADTPGQSTRKMSKNEKCHEIGPSGSDFDKNLCGRRYFSWRICLGGPDPIRRSRFFEQIRIFPETLGRRRDFLKSPVSFKKFG